MNKETFLNALRERLSRLPQDDIEERLAFYGEMIDDRIEEGMTEEEAVAAVGTVEEIAKQVTSEIPLHKLVAGRVKPKRKLKGWEIALLIIASPVWIPLLAALVVIVFSAVIALWAGAACVYAVTLVFGVTAVLSLPAAVFLFTLGIPSGGLFLIGAALFLAGLTILMVFLSILVTKGVLFLSRKFLTWLKSRFTGKEGKDHENA
ncbi:MAG: DUF1700 domain-containing protein [Lachnospiraceae bacterium]|nr:DUF1700 domain-containing protein [Lachnospiraceae bacterium]